MSELDKEALQAAIKASIPFHASIDDSVPLHAWVNCTEAELLIRAYLNHPNVDGCIKALEVENAALRLKLERLEEWFWPADDTSSEPCADSPRDAVEGYLHYGQVAAYACGGIVRTGYFGFLPPADDDDSDDNFEVDEPTLEEAQSKLDAELARRALLTKEASE